jgi:PAS domain S-box-containing protein
MGCHRANASLVAKISMKASNFPRADNIYRFERHAPPEANHRSVPLDEGNRVLSKLSHTDLLDHLPHMIWMADADGRALDFNKRWTDYTGLSKARSRNWGFLEAIHPEDRPRFRREWEAALKWQNSYTSELFLRRCDGCYRRAIFSGEPIRNDRKEIVGWIGTYTEAKKLERIESELQQKQSFLDTLLDNLSDAIVACNAEGVLTLFNRAAREYHGLPHAALPAREWAEYYDLYRADGKTRLETEEIPLWRALQGESVRNCEMQIVPKQGSARAVLASGDPIRSVTGKIVGAIVAMRDVSDRVAAEKALRDSEQRFRAVFHQTFQFIGFMRPDGILLEANQTALDFGGFTAESVVGQPFWQAPWWSGDLAADDTEELTPKQKRLKAAVERAAAGEFVRYEVEVYGKNGAIATIDFSIKPIYDNAGQVIFLIPEGRDITERKQAEVQIQQLNAELELQIQHGTEQLVQSERLYRKVVNSVDEVIFQTDANGYWTFLSPAWTKITEYNIEESLYTPLTNVVYAAEDRYQLAALFESLIAGEREDFEYECRCLTKTDNFRWLEIYVQRDRTPQSQCKPNPSCDCQIFGAYGTINDITERKQTEAVLKARADELAKQRQQIHLQNLQLQEASQLKSQFLATMSHELRTPMNAIMGFSQMLLLKQQGSLNEKQFDMVERIFNNSQNLLTMLNEVLDFSKIEAGRLEVNPEPLDLAMLVTFTVEELRALAIKKQLNLQVHLDLQNVQAIVDRNCLRRILINLVSNAVKFTESGSITIKVWESEPERIAIAVTDTGIGISPGQIEEIFDAFRQLDQTLTRKHSGTGLGLAIAKSIVQMMNGTITVESQLGQGSTFKVEFPRHVQS